MQISGAFTCLVSVLVLPTTTLCQIVIQTDELTRRSRSRTNNIVSILITAHSVKKNIILDFELVKTLLNLKKIVLTFMFLDRFVVKIFSLI